MAFEKKIIDQQGIECNYHKISSVEFNYDNNQVRIVLDSYAKEKYRKIEKDDVADYNKKISEYESLRRKHNSLSEKYQVITKMMSSNNTIDEATSKELSKMNDEITIVFEELKKYNIQELEAKKVNKRCIRRHIITLPLTDDIRNNLYSRIEKEIIDFNESKTV